MKKIWKNISTYAAVVLLSMGATYGMYSFLEYKKDYSTSDLYNYGKAFDQKNIHLASLTSGGYPDFTKAAESSLHAVVHVKSTVQAKMPQQRQRPMDPFEYFFGFGDRGGESYGFGTPQPSVGMGSGVLISADGYIITNNHVIEKADVIEITLNDNSKYKAKLIGTDPNTDIALLKIDGKDFPYIPFGDSDKLKVGEWVLAVGNPFNLTSTVTAGIVSAKSRGNIGAGREQDGINKSIQSFIQTDAAINPGNSGGALVNTDGQLVGINTAIYSQTGSFTGYGFAVPISIAGKVVADIKEYGTVQRALLGVTIGNVSDFKESQPEKSKSLAVNEGVYVAGFSELGSPAKQAGIEEGDVIIAINNNKVRNTAELQDMVNRFRPGDKVKVNVKRGNSDKTFDVILKNDAGGTAIVKKGDAISTIGAAFKVLSAEKKRQLGISYGVEVAGVDASGKFSKVGISKGFIIQKINDQPVSTPEEVESIIQAAANSTEKNLFIVGATPTGTRRYYAVELEE